MFDFDLWEYEQAQYKLTTETMSMAYAVVNKSIEDLGDAIRRRSNRDFEDMECLNKEICELRINIVEYFEQNNTSFSVKSSRLNESELTIYQIAHSVPLPHIHLSTWTIGHEQDKKKNTPKKSSPETVVQETVGYICTKIKKGEQCDHLSKTHLKKEEALGVQSTLQAQFKEKQNTLIFEPIDDKDSILKMSRRQILDESENPCRLPNFIQLSYSQKLERKDMTAFSRSCKAIFQGCYL